MCDDQEYEELDDYLQQQFVFAMYPELRYEEEQNKQRKKEKSNDGFVNQIEKEYKRIFNNLPTDFLITLFHSDQSLDEKVEFAQQFYKHDYWINEFDRSAMTIPICKFIEHLEIKYELDLNELDDMDWKNINYKCLQQLATIPNCLDFLLALKFHIEPEAMVEMMKTNDPLLQSYLSLSRKSMHNESQSVFGLLLEQDLFELFCKQLANLCQTDQHDQDEIDHLYQRPSFDSYSICLSLWHRHKHSKDTQAQYKSIIHILAWFELFDNGYPQYEAQMEKLVRSFVYQITPHILQRFSFEQLDQIHQSRLIKEPIVTPKSLFTLIKHKNTSLLKFALDTMEQQSIEQAFREINKEFNHTSFVYGGIKDHDLNFLYCVATIDVICQYDAVGFQHYHVCKMLNDICKKPDWHLLLNTPGYLKFILNHFDFIEQYHFDIRCRSYKILEKLRQIYNELIN